MADAIPWHAKILSIAEGTPVGLGVHIGEGRIITCAHVVQQAIGEAAIASRPVDHVPDDYIPVVFPHSGDSSVHRAQVLGGGWFPKQAEAGDLAVLQVDSQDTVDVMAARLRMVGPLASRMSERPVIEVLGYPSPYASGVWSRARLAGRAGPNVEWIQLDAPTLTGKRIQAGYSGAGVIDEGDGQVIGCVVAEDAAVEDRTAWMIPTDVIAQYWPQLQSMCGAAPPAGQLWQEPKLPQDERLDRLARLLNAHSAFASRAEGRLYAAALESRFPGRLHIDISDTDNDDVKFTAAIVYACAAHPGALDVLAEFLGTFPQPQDAGVFSAIKAAIEELDPSPLLKYDDRNSLYRNLDIVDPYVRADMVIRSYWAAVPQLNQPEIDWLRLPLVARRLEAMPAQGALPPLVHFLEILCGQLPEDETTGLRGWVDALARRENLDREQIERLRFSPDLWSSAMTQGYLLTEVTPYGAGSDLYLPRIILQHRDSGRVTHGRRLYPPDGRGDEPVPWATIPQLFDAAISRIWAEPLGSARRNLIVEFTLPVPLLSEPVDQWEIESSATAHPVGIDYVVVIRIWDRTANFSLLNRSIAYWENKSSRLRVGNAAMLWIDPEDEQYVRAGLYGQLSLGDRAVLGMLKPPPLPGVPANDAISIAIRTGVPAMLWRRGEPISESLVSWINEFVSRNGLLELPEYILGLRREAANTNLQNASTAGLANMAECANLTLIWDLADRSALDTHRTGSTA